MPAADSDNAGYVAAWRPASVPAEAAAFARAAVTGCGPLGRDRAKNLLWAAGKLAGYGIGLGLEPVPHVLLHPSVIERFAAHAPGLSGPARRTLRTNLRFIARRVVPHLDPADAPLPRERAKAPYTPAEISGYLALADAQPTAARRMRAAALVCLGAGAGLIRSDLRNVRGTDIGRRCGGVIVTVRGGRAPRAVPVLARYHARLLAAAEFAGTALLLTGGTGPARHNISQPADPVAGRRDRAAAAGHLPAARHLAGRAAHSCSACPRSCTPPGSPAPSGSATSSPAWTPAARSRPSRCSARACGEHPAGRAGSHRRRIAAPRRRSRHYCRPASATGS